MSARHSAQRPGDGIHLPVSFIYTDEVARLAAVGFVEADDLYKWSIQEDDKSLWLLAQISPSILWKQITVNGVSIASDKVAVSAVKASAGTISKGQVVYATGFNSGMNAIEVELAQANSATTMPVVGIANEEITNVTAGDVIAFGVSDAQDTSAFSVGSTLYLSPSTAGGLTETKPSSPMIVQVVGKVLSSNATTGAVFIDSEDTHGDLAGGSLHEEATASAAGFMSTGDKVKLDKATNTVYGNDYTFSYTEAPTISTSNAAEAAVPSGGMSMTFNNRGYYKVQVTYKFSNNSTNSDGIFRLRQDSVLLGEEHREELQDSGGSFGSTGTDQRHTAIQSFIVDTTNETNFPVIPSTRSYSLNVISQTDNVASSAFNVLIECFQVSE